MTKLRKYPHRFTIFAYERVVPNNRFFMILNSKGMSLNKVMLIGNVGSDPEIRYLEGTDAQSSTKVASIRLATSERYRDRNNELREITEWHSITAWRGNADLIEKYVRKGTQLYVEGRIRTRSWTDRDNNTRHTTEILADSIQLLGRRSDNSAAGASPLQPARPAQPQPVPLTAAPQPVSVPQSDTEPDDDLPF